MADEADALIDLATAIADGAPVDWPSVRSSSLSEADRAVLQHLRVIAEIVSLQLGLPSQPVHTSVVDELREEAPRVPDAREALPSWGPLRLIGLAGQGAFGEVYRAWDSRLDREVALKLLRRRESRRSTGSTLVDEGRLLAKVRHPNVITVYGAERIGDHVGIWMEFVHGPTLAQLVASTGPFAPDEVARIGRDLCSALAAVHRAGLLHRDIKAQNVMRDADGRIVLMDFGAGRDEQSGTVSPRDMAGTPLYLAPEIFEGAAASVQSDIYSLGVLLYHLATGAYPVDASTFVAIRDRHRRGDRRPLADARPDLPRALVGVIDRALAPEPAARFISVESMEAALAALAPAAPQPAGRHLTVVSIVAAAALIMAALFAVQRAMAPRVTSGMIIRRVAANAPVDGTTGLSSDGRLVSHVDWIKTGNLVLTDLTTGETRALTGKTSWLESDDMSYVSAFSPDDKLVAYVWFTADEGYDLRVVGADGSQPRVLYHDDETVYIPFVEWSPDGKSLLLVLTRRDDTHQLALLPVAGGRPRVLKTFDGRLSPGKVCFSPDGRYLAYDVPQKEGAPERDIVALAVDGSREAPLVQHRANDLVLGWTPDGRRLLFDSDRNGTRGAWSVAVVDGTAVATPELFRPDLGSGWPIRVTPDGSYYYRVDVAMNDIYTATLDATLRTIVEPPAQAAQRFAGTNKWPEWSPDGRQLAYVSQTTPGTHGSGPQTLAIESLDNGTRRELTPQLTFFSRLRWAPDGGSLLANARDDQDRGGLFRIDVQSGETILLVRSKGLPRQAAWFRDSKAILYWDAAAGPDAPIMKRDLTTGAEQQVHRGGDFALSPDNRWLVVNQNATPQTPSVLRLVSLGGGVTRDLMEGGSSGFLGGCSWAPDSRRGLCIRAPEGRASELWRFSIDASPAQRVLAMDGMSEVRVNPDGRRIVFSVGRGFTELWVMENFLPVPATRTP